MIIVGLGSNPAGAQLGPRGGGQGPHLGGAMDKLFAANQMFAATLEIESPGPSGGNITMPGKLSFDHGKSRFEINMSEVQGGGMSPSMLQQIKMMGMDSVITIARPDLKVSYLIYPGLNSYAEVASRDTAASTNLDDYKIETSNLGKETVDGHDCVKNKVTVTDKEGGKHESTVWNASDLKDFPVKIESTEEGRVATMRFKNVSFDKPGASLFEAPSGLTKYDNVQTMMQTEMMKKMGGGAGMPPTQH